MKDKEIANFIAWLKTKSIAFGLWYSVVFMVSSLTDFLIRKTNKRMKQFRRKEVIIKHNPISDFQSSGLNYLNETQPSKKRVLALSRIQYTLATPNSITFDEVKMSVPSFNDEQDIHAAYRLRFLPLILVSGLDIAASDLDEAGAWMLTKSYDRYFWHPYTVSERIIHLCWSQSLLKTQGRNNRFMNSIYAQGKYLRDHFEFELGHHNHLINNARALLTAAILLGDFPEAADWKKCALNVFKAEWPHQVLPDGVHAEQSVTYHFLLTRTLWEMKYLMEQAGEEFPFNDDLNKMIRYAKAITRPDGSIPFIGHLTPDWHWKELVGLLPVWGYDDVPVSDLGRLYKRQVSNIKPQEERKQNVLFFPSAGQGILRTEKIHAVLCCDPRGMVTMHGDQNFLGLDLWYSGTHLIRDAGLASYNLDAKRSWYESWQGQSTFSIDHFDPIVSKWRKRQLPEGYHKVATTFQCDAEAQTLKASHSGYERLPDPVNAQRQIRLKGESDLYIEDDLQCKGQHSYSAKFHFGKNTVKQVSDRSIHISDLVKGNSFELHWNGDLEFAMEENPFAIAYGEELMGNSATFKCTFTGNTKIEYWLKPV